MQKIGLLLLLQILAAICAANGGSVSIVPPDEKSEFAWIRYYRYSVSFIDTHGQIQEVGPFKASQHRKVSVNGFVYGISLSTPKQEVEGARLGMERLHRTKSAQPIVLESVFKEWSYCQIKNIPTNADRVVVAAIDGHGKIDLASLYIAYVRGGKASCSPLPPGKYWCQHGDADRPFHELAKTPPKGFTLTRRQAVTVDGDPTIVLSYSDMAIEATDPYTGVVSRFMRWFIEGKYDDRTPGSVPHEERQTE